MMSLFILNVSVVGDIRNRNGYSYLFSLSENDNLQRIAFLGVVPPFFFCLIETIFGIYSIFSNSEQNIFFLNPSSL